MSPESYKEREKQRREEEIIGEAGRLIRERGYHELTMDMLAEAVGISKPTLYQHFKSKEDLIVSVIRRSFEAFEAHLQTTTHLSSLERLEEALRWLMQRRYTKQEMMGGIMPEAYVTLMATNPELLRERTRLKDQICVIIEQGRARGEIQTDTPPSVLAAMLFTMVNLPHVAGAAHGAPITLDDLIDHTAMLYMRAAEADE